MLEMKLADKFCSCVGKVHGKLRDKSEGRAIAICVKSVLQTRGKTLKKFKCRGKSMLQTTRRNRTRRSR
jgi:hypothetical protein